MPKRAFACWRAEHSMASARRRPRQGQCEHEKEREEERPRRSSEAQFPGSPWQPKRKASWAMVEPGSTNVMQSLPKTAPA
eukprot:15006615-Alexandrium_andersonii.AAC.1